LATPSTDTAACLADVYAIPSSRAQGQSYQEQIPASWLDSRRLGDLEYADLGRADVRDRRRGSLVLVGD
jgi:hypothetical protein